MRINDFSVNLVGHTEYTQPFFHRRSNGYFLAKIVGHLLYVHIVLASQKKGRPCVQEGEFGEQRTGRGLVQGWRGPPKSAAAVARLDPARDAGAPIRWAAIAILY